MLPAGIVAEKWALVRHFRRANAYPSALGDRAGLDRAWSLLHGEEVVYITLRRRVGFAEMAGKSEIWT